MVTHTFSHAFFHGEKQQSHGTGRGLSELMGVMYHKHFRPIRDLLLTNNKYEGSIIHPQDLYALFPEPLAVEVANAANWQQTIGNQRAGGRPEGIHIGSVVDKIFLLQQPLITTSNYDDYLNRWLAAAHHDSVEDLAKSIEELEEYLLTGNIGRKYALPEQARPTIQHHTNIIKPLVSELITIIERDYNYSDHGITAAINDIDERIRNGHLGKGLRLISDKIDELWITTNGDYEREDEKARAIISELDGTLTRYGLFFKLFEGTPLPDQVIKLADGDENGRDDKELKREKTKMRVRRGGKSIIINDHYDKNIAPKITDEHGAIKDAYIPHAILNYAIMEHALRKFNTKGYINNQYISKEDKKDEYYKIRDRVRDFMNKHVQALNDFKERPEIISYIGELHLPEQSKQRKTILL